MRKNQSYRNGHDRWKLDVYLPKEKAPKTPIRSGPKAASKPSRYKKFPSKLKRRSLHSPGRNKI